MAERDTKAEIQKLFDGFEDRYVLTTPDGRTFAFRTKATASKYRGTVERAKVQRRAFHGVRPGKPAPVVKRRGRWYPAASRAKPPAKTAIRRTKKQPKESSRKRLARAYRRVL